MNAHHLIPAQYCFALDFKHYQECVVQYASISVLYYQFATDSVDETVVIADGCADFQFCCDEREQSAMLWGSVISPTVIQYQPNTVYCGVRFSTSMSRRLSCLPYRELVNQGVSLADIMPVNPTLLDGLSAATDFADRVKILENWLMASGVLDNRKTDLVDHCLERIQSGRGSLRITDISHELGVSDRLLRKKFNESVGVSPKQYSRIVRFQDTLQKVLYDNVVLCNKEHGIINASYYDDSHLIKDFQYFTQKTPGWFREAALKLHIERHDVMAIIEES